MKVIIATVSAVILAAYPLASAKEVPYTTFSEIVITEVQTTGLSDAGVSSAGVEAIEIYNNSLEAVDLAGWKLQKSSASGLSWQTKLTLDFVIQPRSYAFFATADFERASEATAIFNSGLAADAGHVRLIKVEQFEVETIETVVDLVGWGAAEMPETTAASLAGEGQSIARVVDEFNPGIHQDTDDNSSDFVVVDNPDFSNRQTLVDVGQTEVDVTTANLEDTDALLDDEDDESSDPLTNSGDDSPTENIDQETGDDESLQEGIEDGAGHVDQEAEAKNIFNIQGLTPLVINEILANPASPVTDAEGEFIELYNPNPTVVNLAGLVIEMGNKYSYKLEFESETIGPKSYLTIYSRDYPITLSNSSSRLRMVVDGRTWGQEVVYTVAAKDGLSYAIFDGSYKYTTTPTPGKPNLFTVKASKKKTTATKTTSKKKTTSVKKASSSSAKLAAVPVPANTYQSPADLIGSDPSWFVVGGFISSAILYSLYEYRQEISFRLHRLRRH